jgi:hypothetical protein
MNRVVKSVSFNLDDPFEKEMYHYSMRFKGFSTFIKRLIQTSIDGKNEKLQPKLAIDKSPFEQVVIKEEYLKQLI